MGAWAVELLTVERATVAERGLTTAAERATAAERGLTAAKVHLTKSKVVL